MSDLFKVDAILNTLFNPMMAEIGEIKMFFEKS